MDQSHLNPYQPCQPADWKPDLIEDSLAAAVSFRLTLSMLRHGEAQYLLHYHATRLMIGSLLIILANVLFFILSLSLGPLVFPASLPIALTVSALAYLALVHRSKARIREQLHDHGLLGDVGCSVLLNDQQLTLTTPGGRYQWPAHEITSYRTRRGLLLCPQPLLFILVPKRNESSPSAFQSLLKIARQISRSAAA